MIRKLLLAFGSVADAIINNQSKWEDAIMHYSRRMLTVATLIVAAALGELAANHLQALEQDRPSDWTPNVRHIVDYDTSPLVPAVPTPPPETTV